ncbi:MAG: FkbM family methyltransferase, partial [Gaiellaceae bacterium]
MSLPLEGRVVYDVGAWEGTTALALSRRVGPTGQIWAFEPNPESVARMRTNLELNAVQNVKILEFAVGDAHEVVAL